MRYYDIGSYQLVTSENIPGYEETSFLADKPVLLGIREGEKLRDTCIQNTRGVRSLYIDENEDDEPIKINLNKPGILEKLDKTSKKKYKVNMLGLGDVGGTLLTGLKIDGGDIIDEIGIFDLNPDRLKRYEYEINQIFSINKSDEIKVSIISMDELFDCDMFLFIASKFIPEVGSKIKDVRMAQFEANAQIVKIYAKIVREKGYKGIFAVVSDPVDLLCKVAHEESNRDEEGNFDNKGLLSTQVRGYGLGVMYARARYFAMKKGLDYFRANGRAYGPHGKDLVVVDNISEYNEEISLALTKETVNANHLVRDTGFKPYIAPAISSGVYQILDTLRGKWNYSAVFLDGVYFGVLNRMNQFGFEVEKIPYNEEIDRRLLKTYENLMKVFNENYNNKK